MGGLGTAKMIRGKGSMLNVGGKGKITHITQRPKQVMLKKKFHSQSFLTKE